MNSSKLVIPVGFIFGFISTIVSFIIFSRTIDTLGSAYEWKFYASLTGFVIFLSMFLVLVIILLLNKFLIKTT